MNKRVLIVMLCAAAITNLGSLSAQEDAFSRFKQQQNDKFEKFKDDKQAEFDAFRKRMNDEYAEFMRKNWEAFPANTPDKPIKEPVVPPVVLDEDTLQPKPQPKPPIETKPIEIPVKPKPIVVPAPQPAPEPIAPVKPKEETYKKVSLGYFGTIITIGFPKDDNLKLRALEENAIADAWQQLSDSRYDIAVSTALNARQAYNLCDWAYMNLLQAATEKHYGKTNEAVLAQAYLMTQSGYRIRLAMSENRLYMLVASLYDIFNYTYYVIDGSKFYNTTGEKNLGRLKITQARFDKEQSVSLQIRQLPSLGSEPTPKRTLTSRKGVTTSVSLNKNMIDFFDTYPQACFDGDQTTRWAAYANTPVEQSVKDMLYPSLKKTIKGMSEKEAVGILLNWMQTAFEYKLDNQVWGGDRAFFAQETLYYPYCDCEDRAILFSRLVRDLTGLDVVLLYYPGHLAAAVAFKEDVNGDYLTYKSRKYIVCDPTFINAGVGRTMPGMNNQQAQIIALK